MLFKTMSGILGHFNSIKVRLERRIILIIIYLEIFQFHKGAIRTVRTDKSAYYYVSFQFHKGAIRTVKAEE